MKTLLPLCLIALGLAATSSRATLLYSQDFEMLANGNLDGQGGLTALAAAQVVDGGGLSYAAGDVDAPGASKHVTFTGLNPANNWVFTGSIAPQSDTVYFSLAMTWSNQTENDFLYFALSDGGSGKSVALGNSGGIVINRFVNTNGAIGGRIRGNTVGDNSQEFASVANGNAALTPQYIVASLSKKDASINYNTLSLWINPTSLTEGMATHTITRDMGISGGLDTFYFFSGAGNESDETIRVDNIRIGTTYAAVVIPEPSAVLLMLVAGLGLLAARRRV